MRQIINNRIAKKIVIIFLLLSITLNAIMPVTLRATEDIESEMTGVDTVTGLILEPTVEFYTFILDSLMSILTMIMTQENIQDVMVKIEDVPELGDAGGEFPIEDMEPYKRASGILNIQYPNFTYSSEEIFEGKYDLLDINFISSDNEDDDWGDIRAIVSQWYQILRMVAIIGLLSVLIYIGIKIIISSNTKDKAKYKEMILNWFIAVVLAFSMHYIMAFILAIIEEIMGVFGGLTGVIEVTAGEETFKTNLIGLARFQIQQQHFSAKVGHLVIYTALVVYTFKFTLLYLKRVLRVAFLTVISPIVALTYPIDKMEGKAKGFEIWINEFTYNALLQPMHYILYYILVTTSLSLAANNPIYGIAALMFLSQAERMLKSIFGFNKAKAGTVGGIAGAFATTAIASTVVNAARDPLHPFGGGKRKRKGKGGRVGSGHGVSQGQLGSGNNEELYGLREDTDFDDYEHIDMRNGYRTGDYSRQDDVSIDGTTSSPTSISGETRMPLVDDFINRYRQGIPQEELGELDFNDGYGGMKSILRQIYYCEKKLNNVNLSDDERQELNEKLFGLKTALKNRLEFNESGFNEGMIPLQYADGDNRTNSELLDEIMRLWELTSKTDDPNEKQRYMTDARKLMRLVNRRMKENQYIQNQGGPQALLEQERYRQLSSTINDDESFDPVVNGNAGPRFGNTSRNGDTPIDGRNPRNGTTPIDGGRNPRNGANPEDGRNGANPEEVINSSDDTNPELEENSNNEETSRREVNQSDEATSRRARQRYERTSRVNPVTDPMNRQNPQQENEIQEDEGIIKRIKNAPITRGLENVGKTIIKPVWDTEKDIQENAGRLVGKIIKTAAGVTVGIGAAAVQAGISITDGKYKPAEGIATVTAGVVGVSAVANRIEGNKEIKYSEDDQKSLERYSQQWYNRDDIIGNYNREFPGKGKEMRRRAVNNYVSRGITDFEQQRQAINFAELLKKERGMGEEEADWIAAGTLRYRQNLVSHNNYDILYNAKKKKNYLDVQADAYTGSASREAVRQKHEDFLQNVLDFDRANR